MKISSISNFIPKNNFNNSNKNVSFKSVYIQDIASLEDKCESSYPPKFFKRDALLLNRIAQDYPNQDCFIKRGLNGSPRLEYREKPPEVQVFTSTMHNTYNIEIQKDDEDYPCEPLIIYENSNLTNYLGLPSYISLNPSLAYTVKTGYELHKKLLEKQYQIKEEVGRSDEFDIGNETLTKKAHKAIADIEVAVVRHLMESAYAALTDRASAKQIYESDYPKVQTKLDAERTFELLTSIAKHPQLNPDNLNKIDVCEMAMKKYPNRDENQKRIEYLADHMAKNGICL